MAALNLSQKILARASGRVRVDAGEVVTVRFDRAMTYDPYARMLLQRFHARWGEAARIWDPERLVLVADHFLELDDPAHAAMHDALAELAKRHRVRHYYPIGARNHGVCHALLAEEGLVRPGELIAGTDSHSCHYGGFGAIGLGIGVDAMEGVLAVGQYWLQVPPVVRIEIDGTFPGHVYAKDVILRLAGELANEKGLLGKAVELDGDAVQALHPEEKLTLANMAAELGARWLVIPPNRAVCEWVRRLTDAPFEPQGPDAGAAYQRVLRFEGGGFEPVVALPGAPDRVMPLARLPRTPIDEVYVGSCTGAKRYDLERFMAALGRGGGIAEGVALYLVPATRRVRDWLLGDRQRRELLERCGAHVAPLPGCNACFGGHGFVAPEGAIRVSTTNRNFAGRMGAPSARVYLGSPALAGHAAATASIGG